MQIEYTGRQFTITKPLHAIGDEGVERIGKILGRITTAKVILSAEKYRQSAEITINTRLQSIVGLSESTSMEIALREAIAKAETQAIRYKDRLRARKRKPKEEKVPEDSQLARTRRTGRAIAIAASAAKPKPGPGNARAGNGNGRAKPRRRSPSTRSPRRPPSLSPTSSARSIPSPCAPCPWKRQSKKPNSATAKSSSSATIRADSKSSTANATARWS